MNDTVKHIKSLHNKIDKLEKDFNKGVHSSTSFTIDLYYGGNKEVDVNRIGVGSLANPEKDSQILYDLLLRNLKSSLIFWEDRAKGELAELTLILNNDKI